MAKIIKTWVDHCKASDGRTIKTVANTYWCKAPTRAEKAAMNFVDGRGQNQCWTRMVCDEPGRQMSETFRRTPAGYWIRTTQEYSYA